MNAPLTVDHRCIAIMDMDSCSQEMSTSIEAIARLTLESLKAPAGWRDQECIVSAMTTIVRMAQGAWDVLIYEANDLTAGGESIAPPVRTAVETIIREAKASFLGIAAVAHLTKTAIQAAGDRRTLADVPGALSAIIYMASDVRNEINAAAEDAGANHIDEDEERMWAARCEYLKGAEHACRTVD